MTSPLVTTSWLEEHLEDPKVRILEVSSADDDASYRKAHVPGAVWQFWKDFCWHETDRQFITPEETAARLASPEPLPPLAARMEDELARRVGRTRPFYMNSQGVPWHTRLHTQPSTPRAASQALTRSLGSNGCMSLVAAAVVRSSRSRRSTRPTARPTLSTSTSSCSSSSPPVTWSLAASPTARSHSPTMS